MNTNEITRYINILAGYMADCSSDGVTKIPTYGLLHVINMLKKQIIEEEQPYLLDVITVENPNRNAFECAVNNWVRCNYKIIASSCNSKTWKAILQKDNEKESE